MEISQAVRNKLAEAPEDAWEAAKKRAEGQSILNERLAAGRIELRFAWLIDQIEARFPGSIDPFSSRPPELSALEAIDKMMMDKAANVKLTGGLTAESEKTK